MNSDQLGGLVRNILMPFAAMAAAHGIAAGTYDGIVGALVALAIFGWGILSHSTTQAMLGSVVRSIIGAGGGYFIQRGWATADQVTLYIAVGVSFVPNIWTVFAHAAPTAIAPPAAKS